MPDSFQHGSAHITMIWQACVGHSSFVSFTKETWVLDITSTLLQFNTHRRQTLRANQTLPNLSTSLPENSAACAVLHPQKQ